MSFEASRRRPLPHVEILGPVDPAETARVTVILRRRAPLPDPGAVVLTREQLRERHGADPAELAAVRDGLEARGLRVVHADAGSRRVQVEGTVAQLEDVFGTRLHSARGRAGAAQPQTYRYRTGTLTLPEELAPATIAVLGLDTRPQASAHFRIRPRAEQESASFTPLQVGQAYRFPDGYDGTGRTIALIELGGGYDTATLAGYFQGLAVAAPQVTAVPVDGGSNSPTGDANGPDGEVQLDIEVAGALAPGASFAVYFAPNTDQGFVDAVTDAAHATPTPTAISISWGSPEDGWTAQSREALDAACADAVALGVTVLAAAGDSGSSDGDTDGSQHCDFPASSPNVLACGGTRLQLDAGGAIAAETVWNDQTQGGGATGGGVSTLYPLPSWQAGAGVPANADTGNPGRGVPDVSGNADPQSGYQVTVDGQQAVIGGTSAVAPLWAALVARLAQQAGRPLGLAQNVLYQGVQAGAAQPGFQDVTSGGNGAYSAGTGWDACTGLGSPDGAALAALFAPAAVPAPTAVPVLEAGPAGAPASQDPTAASALEA